MGRQQRTAIYHAFPALCLIAMTCLVATTASRTTTATADSPVARDRESAGSRATGTTAVADHSRHSRDRRYIISVPVLQQQPSLSQQSQNALVRSRAFDRKFGKLFHYKLRMDRDNRL